MFSKYKIPIITLTLVLLCDQITKLYIKSHFPYGDVVTVLDNWFKITFIENPGMAFGMEFGGDIGKLLLSSIRIIAVFFGFYYIIKIVKQQESTLYIICVSLILAGALGNIIDSILYGLIFTETTAFQAASFTLQGNGYASFLHGKVVDFFYFPIYQGIFPDWVPIIGGQSFEFFNAIFNIADMAISFGIGIILAFNKRIFKQKSENEPHET